MVARNPPPHQESQAEFRPLSREAIEYSRDECWPALSHRLERRFGFADSTWLTMGAYARDESVVRIPLRDDARQIVGELFITIDGDEKQSHVGEFRGLIIPAKLALPTGGPLLIAGSVVNVASCIELGQVVIGMPYIDTVSVLKRLVDGLKCEFVMENRRHWGSEARERIIVV